MTDLEIMQILTSDVSIFEKGQAFRKAIDAMRPSALNLTPMKPRAKRGPNKAKEAGKVNVLGVMLDSGANGHDDHEAH